jgi:predicted nucleic acid-binding protein
LTSCWTIWAADGSGSAGSRSARPRDAHTSSGVARRSGVTIRKTLDCLIAVPCVRTAAPLLHADADFDRLATCTPLRIYES